jgi:ketosteroid isomerase-like protein
MAWNRADPEGLRGLQHIPNVTIQATRLLISDTEQALRREQDFRALATREGWHQSMLDNLDVWHHSGDKVHCVLTFGRYAAGGRRYADGRATCIMTRRRGRWAIQLYSGALRPVGTEDGDERLTASAATGVVEEWHAAFNRRDMAGLRALVHPPHVELVGARLVIRPRPAELRVDFRTLAARTRWDHSVIQRLDVRVQSAQKVTLEAEVARFDRDGGLLGCEPSLYIVTELDRRWAIQVTSRLTHR